MASGSALGHYTISTALAPEPPARAFLGWIEVLQPATAIGYGVEVRVNAYALTHAPRPKMAYVVTVCGSGPLSGYFLIDGDARLEREVLDGGTAETRQLPVGDLTVADQADGTVVEYPSVLVIQVSIKEAPQCLGTVDEGTYIGDGFRIEGTEPGPVVASGVRPLLDGAVERWSMPYVEVSSKKAATGSLPHQWRDSGRLRQTCGPC